MRSLVETGPGTACNRSTLDQKQTENREGKRTGSLELRKVAFRSKKNKEQQQVPGTSHWNSVSTEPLPLRRRSKPDRKYQAAEGRPGSRRVARCKKRRCRQRKPAKTWSQSTSKANVPWAMIEEKGKSRKRAHGGGRKEREQDKRKGK